MRGEQKAIVKTFLKSLHQNFLSILFSYAFNRPFNLHPVFSRVLSEIFLGDSAQFFSGWQLEKKMGFILVNQEKIK